MCTKHYRLDWVCSENSPLVAHLGYVCSANAYFAMHEGRYSVSLPVLKPHQGVLHALVHRIWNACHYSVAK